MARQYRLQTADLYQKLGMKSSPSKAISIFDEGSSTFHLTAPRHKRANSTMPVKIKTRPKPKLKYNPNHIQSPISFDKQLARPDLLKNSLDVNANRFIAFNHSPPALSNTRRISSPNFALYQGRKKSLMYSSLEDQPSYDPNYSQVFRSTERGLIAFEKLQGRRESRPKSTLVPRDIDYTCVDKKVRSPLLGKTQPKPCDPILPAFMLEAITRGNMITQKGLEMNSFGKGNYMPMTSTFGHGWKQEEITAPLPIRGKCPKIVKLLSKTLNHFKWLIIFLEL